MIMPRLEILAQPQRRIWDELVDTPGQFTLYGGTAIALRLGHRESVDFDFFSLLPFVSNTLLDDIPYLANAVVRRSAANTLTCTVDRDGPVQFSYFGALRIGQVAPAEQVAGPGFAVASMLDLAGMKAAVITQRAELKDYLDIHALLITARITLPDMLAAAVAIYPERFNPLICLKALTWFEEPALARLPVSIRSDLVTAVRAIDPARLPSIEPFRRSP